MRYLVFIVLLMGTAVTILYSGFVLPTIMSLTVLLIAISIDFLSTWLCTRIGGREGNPVIAFLFRKIGVLATFALMGVVWSAFITLRWLPQGVDVQTAVAFAYWLVPMNNLIVLMKLRRRVARS